MSEKVKASHAMSAEEIRAEYCSRVRSLCVCVLPNVINRSCDEKHEKNFAVNEERDGEKSRPLG